jgi:hypothetical protein
MSLKAEPRDFYEPKSAPFRKPSPNQDLQEVELRGKLFDEISSIVHETPYIVSSPAFHNLPTLTKHWPDMQAWEVACRSLVSQFAEYPTGERVLEVYWRTLIFDSEVMELYAEDSSKLKAAYNAWVGLFETGGQVLEYSKSLQVQSISAAIQAIQTVINPKPTSFPERFTGFADKMSLRWQQIETKWKLQRKLNLCMKQSKACAPFDDAFKRFAFGRKFCTTANGYMGWAPSKAQPGDRLCYFEGCELPFVVRSYEGRYQLIGDSYLHGLMHRLPQGLNMSTLEMIILKWSWVI